MGVNEAGRDDQPLRVHDPFARQRLEMPDGLDTLANHPHVFHSALRSRAVYDHPALNERGNRGGGRRLPPGHPRRQRSQPAGQSPPYQSP